MTFGNNHTVFIENLQYNPDNLEYSTEFRLTYEKELNERQVKHLNQFQKPWKPCLHDQCSECHGTGISRFGGMCVHGISCSCPKCNPTC